MLPTTLITAAVVITTWLTPLPRHASGLIVLYGNERLVAANAQYHGYSMEGFVCGGALMSPADLGKTFWLRRPGGKWFGPCLSVDCAARKDFQRSVYKYREIAEVDVRAAQALNFTTGTYGEVFVGPCPPPNSLGLPRRYLPRLALDYADLSGDKITYLSFVWPFPRQIQACRTSAFKPR